MHFRVTLEFKSNKEPHVRTKVCKIANCSVFFSEMPPALGFALSSWRMRYLINANRKTIRKSVSSWLKDELERRKFLVRKRGEMMQICIWNFIFQLPWYGRWENWSSCYSSFLAWLQVLFANFFARGILRRAEDPRIMQRRLHSNG